MAKLFVNSGDPDQLQRSGSALFASCPFRGLQAKGDWKIFRQFYKDLFFFFCKFCLLSCTRSPF